MPRAPRDTDSDPLVTEQAVEAEAETSLPETATGKEFTVLEVRDDGRLILDASEGAMFSAEGVEGAKPGDVVRVSYDETDENGYPQDAKATSIK